jgi:CheY-like chemotaxis protein
MRSLTILYVEDHTLLLRYVKKLLEAQGWRVETCQDGRHALEMIESSSSYDVFIFDDCLPGMSGLELVREVRQLAHRRHTPIIMLTAGHSSSCARAALRAGANIFLKKPDEIGAIIETVGTLTGAS